MIKVIIIFMAFTLSVFANDYMREDGTFDWESYLSNSANSDYVKQRAYNDTNTLIRLFEHYDKIKDDPFSLGTLSNDIVRGIYNNTLIYREQSEYIYIPEYSEDYDSNIVYNMYKILDDNIDKFDVDKKIKNASKWFLNNQINEAQLFNYIYNALAANRENEVVEIKLRNSDDTNNGLVIKYNGRVVQGILGRKFDYEYTIDYNGKKDVKIKYGQLMIKDNYSNSGYDYLIESTPHHVILIDNNYYYIGHQKYSWRFQGKIRDLNKHEDGITSVEIIK